MSPVAAHPDPASGARNPDVCSKRRLAATVLSICLASAAASAMAESNELQVRRGDTLWQIAGRVHVGANLSRDQIMLALLQANPDSFSPSCNVNGVLRVGARLRLPTREQVAALDAESARRTVQQQARDWAEHRRSGRPLECRTPTPVVASAGAAPAQGAEEGLSGDGPEEGIARRAAPEPPATSTPLLEPEPAGVEAVAPPMQGPPTPVAEEPPFQAGPRFDGGCPCPPERDSTTAQPVAPARVRSGPLLHSEDESSAGPLPPGPRAPAWMITAGVLALIAAAMVRWERRWETATGRPSAIMALQAAAALPRRAARMLAPKNHELPSLLLLAALVGFLGALVTVLFREGIHGLEWLLSGRSGSLVLMAETLSPWQRLVFPAAGGLVAGLILQKIGGWLGGRSTTDYMEAVAVGDGWISVRHSLVKAASSLVTVASGGSIGREGAMVQLAAMVASAMGRVSRLSRDRLRLLVAAGAAAGLASAYNAPIAATLFVAEIVLGSIALEHIGPLIIAAVIANATVHDLLGYAPVYQLPSFSLVSDWELGLYVLLGLAAGHLAPFFLLLLDRAHHLFRRLPMPLAGRLGLGGLVVGMISVYEPQVWGNGYSVVNSVLHSPWVWQALLTVLVLKMLATAATHGSGAVGGAFTPTLFVGALLGSLFGTLVHTMLPVGTAPPNAYGIVGMGAMLAGATHAPLMSILMVLEMTMDYQIVLPLMLAVITAHYTARGYTGVRPMYAESLLPREATS